MRLLANDTKLSAKWLRIGAKCIQECARWRKLHEVQASGQAAKRDCNMRDKQSATQDYSEFKDHFQRSLEMLCRDHSSISALCEACGINRQQFAKYLNGTTLPSVYTTHKLAKFFDVDVSFFFSDPASKRSMYSVPAGMLRSERFHNAPIVPGGYYLEIMKSDMFKDNYLIALSHIDVSGSIFKYHRKMHAQISKNNRSVLWTYKGFGSESGDGLFIFYRCMTTVKNNFGSYILHQSMSGPGDLIGLKNNFTTGAKGVPVATPILFKSIGTNPNLKATMKSVCGIKQFGELSGDLKKLIELLVEKTEASPDRLLMQ